MIPTHRGRHVDKYGVLMLGQATNPRQGHLVRTLPAPEGESGPHGRRAGMQEDSGVDSGTEPSNTNQTGSHITYDRCFQRSCSAKLYALRTGRHGGQRERRLTRPSRKNASNWLDKRSLQGAYVNATYR